MFVFIFFCFLFFFGMIRSAQTGQPEYLVRELKDKFAKNIVSLFLSYAFILAGNYLAYINPKTFSLLFAFYSRSQVNLHAQDLVMLVVKSFYLVLGALVISSVCKYYIRGRIDDQYVALTILAVWCGLFVMSFDHLFIILLLMDAISLITVGLVSISAKTGSDSEIAIGRTA